MVLLTQLLKGGEGMGDNLYNNMMRMLRKISSSILMWLCMHIYVVFLSPQFFLNSQHTLYFIPLQNYIAIQIVVQNHYLRLPEVIYSRATWICVNLQRGDTVHYATAL